MNSRNLAVLLGVTVLLAGPVSANELPIAANGLIQFEPPQAVSCIAVRVEVPEDKMITGLRWHNGSGTEAFPMVLIASGNGFAPPPYSEAFVVAENVQGIASGWSELEFSEPVASQSGTLFILMQYPQNYSPPETGPALGVGYATTESKEHFFVTGDGESWIKVSMACQVLLEPVLAVRLPGVLDKKGKDESSEDLPAHKIGLFVGPNPFNPSIQVSLYLPEKATGTVKVFDIRGRLVAELHRGEFVQGENSFTWRGRDGTGRIQASGAYIVRAVTDDHSWTQRVMLIK